MHPAPYEKKSALEAWCVSRITLIFKFKILWSDQTKKNLAPVFVAMDNAYDPELRALAC